MPKGVHVILDDKKAKGELVEFKATKDYIISYGTQQLLAASRGPAPLMANRLIDHNDRDLSCRGQQRKWIGQKGQT